MRTTSRSGSGPPFRRPRRVYDLGDEPDPRFTLANERALLAWLRTALALVVTGVAVVGLSGHLAPAWKVAPEPTRGSGSDSLGTKPEVPAVVVRLW